MCTSSSQKISAPRCLPGQLGDLHAGCGLLPQRPAPLPALSRSPGDEHTCSRPGERGHTHNSKRSCFWQPQQTRLLQAELHGPCCCCGHVLPGRCSLWTGEGLMSAFRREHPNWLTVSTTACWPMSPEVPPALLKARICSSDPGCGATAGPAPGIVREPQGLGPHLTCGLRKLAAEQASSCDLLRGSGLCLRCAASADQTRLLGDCSQRRPRLPQTVLQ